MGGGDGTFTLEGEYAFTGVGYGIVAGDFNGDGNLDLIVSLGGSVEVYLGRGDGSFQSPLSYTTPSGAGAAVGDFNGDGKLDLAFPGERQIFVLIGDGDGSFQAPVTYPFSAAAAVASVAADLNGDGILDLAVGYDSMACPACNSNIVSILLGNGDGTFQARSDYPVSENSYAVVAGNFYVTITGDFAETNNSPAALSAGSNCVVNITFKPEDIGTRTGVITIGDNNDNMNGFEQQISLSGTGTAVSLSPSMIKFPPQKVRTTNGHQNVTLTNHSLAAVGINGIAIAGPDQGDFAQTNTCGNVVQSRNTCTISVTFTPTAAAVRTATVNVNDTGGGSPQHISLAGTRQ